jgi:DNA topoisomerase-1
VKNIAGKLGNTPAICRKCYIHPVILFAHEEGRLSQLDGASAPNVLRQLLNAGRRTGKSQKNPTHRINVSARVRRRAPTAMTSDVG